MPPARSRNTAPSAMSIRRWPPPSSTTSCAADGRTLHEGPSARAAGNKRACLAEPVRARKAVGAEPAGGAAPRAEIGFRADTVFASPPGKAIGSPGRLGVGDATRLVAPQDDAAAATALP